MSNNKKINLNFFQLIPQTPKQEEEEKKEQIIAIHEMFDDAPDSFRSVRRGDWTVSLYGKLHKKEGVFLGTLIHTQLNDIPPSYDRNVDKIARLPLEEGTGLGYQTSFVYDPETRIIMIESARNGVTINGFCAWVNTNFEIPLLDAALVIDPSQIEKVFSWNTIKKFSVKIAKLESGTIFKGKKKSLGQIINSADDTNTGVLEYTIRADRGKGQSLALSKIRNWVRDFLTYKETDEVEQLIVVGQETEDSPREQIDLIKERLRDFISVRTERLNGSFQIDERQTLLTEKYKEHRKLLKVYKKMKKVDV